MSNYKFYEPTYDNFKSYDELCKSLLNGNDIEFEYGNKKYSITLIKEGVSILEQNNYNTEKIYTKIEEVGNYVLDNKILKNIVTEIKILFRSI